MHPIVFKLLEHLTPSKGPGSGITTESFHPNDRDRVTAFFTVLKELGISFKPPEIEEWLLRSEWWPNKRVVDQVMRIVHDINNGIKKRIRDRDHWIQGTKKKIVTWQKELEENK